MVHERHVVFANIEMDRGCMPKRDSNITKFENKSTTGIKRPIIFSVILLKP